LTESAPNARDRGRLRWATVLPQAQGGGVPAIFWVLAARGVSRPPFAPPILKVGQRLIAQTFERPRIARYLAAGRRVPFNNEDLFRHYPELDH